MGLGMTTDNSYQLVAALFLRLLGVFYLVAFASIGVQIEALAGSQGILPFSEELARLEAQSGLERYLQLPTLFWLDAGDGALTGSAIAGCLVSVLMIIDRGSLPARITAFALYQAILFKVVDDHRNIAAAPEDFFPDVPL